MQNKKLVVLAVLGLLAIFSLFYGIFTPSKTRRLPQVKESDIQSVRKVSMTEKPILAQRVTKRTNYTSWARNPFTLQKTSSKVFEGLILGGIMWDKEKPLAIINDEIVKIGDNVSGNIVVDIKQDKVILKDGAKDFELRIGE
ncbi:MAG: hypothetical protein AABY28_05235 [Candidatus Omnitrophota bacterium]